MTTQEIYKQHLDKIYDGIIARFKDKCEYEKHYITFDGIENVFNYNFLKSLYNEDLGHNYRKYLEAAQQKSVYGEISPPAPIQPKCQFILFILPAPLTFYIYKSDPVDFSNKRVISLHNYDSNAYRIVCTAIEIYAIESEKWKNNSPCFVIDGFYNEDNDYDLSNIGIGSIELEEDNIGQIMVSTDKEILYQRILEHKHNLIKKYTDFMLESMTKLTIIG